MSVIVPGTGKVIKHAKIVLIFWGGLWTRSPKISSAELVSVFEAILATPFMSRMVQYGGIGNAEIVRVINDPTTEFPEQINNAPAFHQSELENMIAGHIDNFTVPGPDTDPGLLYMVVSQLSVVCIEKAPEGAAGFHERFEHNGTTVHYAWISNSGSLTSANTIPKVFVHELTEACSDPEGDSFRRADGQEIGDLCNNNFVVMPNITTPNAPAGVSVQSYFSDLDSGCVMPTFYSIRWWAQATNSDVSKGLAQFHPIGGSVKALVSGDR